jgi:cytochrome b6-f complex iron-sulfur subunit
MSNFSRRDFLNLVKKGLAATGLTALMAPILAYFYPPTLEETPSEAVRVGTLGDIPPGESVTVPFGRYPALVIHTEEGLKAYSAVCTHFACIVKWDNAEGIIFCPCHEGYFNPLTGDVISGPPPLPLKKIPLVIENDEIFIGGAA